MAYSNQTTHYGLPLPVGSDKSSWLDNNTAFAAIDTAIYQASTDAGAAAGDIALLQNDVTSLQSGKQDVLTWDASPTNGSLNAVRSGGVYTAIDNVSIALGVTDLKVSTLEGAMGNTDISAIGDGTVTGAISSLAGGSQTVVNITAEATDTYSTLLTKIRNAFNGVYSKDSKIINSDESWVYNIVNIKDGGFQSMSTSVSAFYFDSIEIANNEWRRMTASTSVSIASLLSNTIPSWLVGTWKCYI